VPPPDILLDTIQYFTDERVGMVQARWGHINRDYSLLTRIQSLMLASDTAGTPFGKRIVSAESLVPGDMSLTMPFIITLFPNVVTSFWIETVVALGPLPIAYTRWSYVSMVAIMLSPMIARPPQRV
jgi:hypothetical protein